MTDAPLTFKEQWEQQRLLKRAKKKAKKSLEAQGFGRKQATKQVNAALNRIVSDRPVRKASGRGG